MNVRPRGHPLVGKIATSNIARRPRHVRMRCRLSLIDWSGPLGRLDVDAMAMSMVFECEPDDGRTSRLKASR